MEESQPDGAQRILAVDVGGSGVKVRTNKGEEVRRVESGPKMTAEQMVNAVKLMTTDWHYDVVAVGYPGAVRHGKIAREPYNLGPGWVKYDFDKAFEKPVKVVNDAAMQAIGSYEGGRMLFLGLGTGLGTVLIVEGVVAPMELGHLPYKKGRTFEEYLGRPALDQMGKKAWRAEVAQVIDELNAALLPDYVVLGGGNAKHLKEMPTYCRLGVNANAFAGGFRIWTDPSIRI